MSPALFLIFSLIPAFAGLLVGRSKGYMLFGFLAGLLLSYVGLAVVVFTRPSHRELVRREKARMAAEAEARERSA